MNLKEDKMFKKNLYNILNELNSMKDSSNTMYSCVENRLNVSLEQYQKHVENTCKYLLSRSNYKVIKAIEKEKEIY